MSIVMTTGTRRVVSRRTRSPARRPSPTPGKATRHHPRDLRNLVISGKTCRLGSIVPGEREEGTSTKRVLRRSARRARSPPSRDREEGAPRARWSRNQHRKESPWDREAARGRSGKASPTAGAATRGTPDMGRRREKGAGGVRRPLPGIRGHQADAARHPLQRLLVRHGLWTSHQRERDVGVATLLFPQAYGAGEG